VVAPQRAIAPVADEQIVPAVVVVIAGADALSPSCPGNARGRGHVCERSIAVILEQPADRRLARRPPRLKTRPVDEKDIQPAIVIVVEEGASAAGGFEQEPVLSLAAEDRLGAQAC